MLTALECHLASFDRCQMIFAGLWRASVRHRCDLPRRSGRRVEKVDHKWRAGVFHN